MEFEIVNVLKRFKATLIQKMRLFMICKVIFWSLSNQSSKKCIHLINDVIIYPSLLYLIN